MMDNSAVRQIQRDYIALIKSHLVAEQLEFHESRLNALQFAERLGEREKTGLVARSSAGLYKSALALRIRALADDVRQFWVPRAQPVVDWIRDSNLLCLSCTVPQVSVQFISQQLRASGLYFDTICITDGLYLNPDALLAHQLETEHPFEFYFLIPYFLLITLAPLLEADCDPPLAIVYPPVLYGDLHVEKRLDEHAGKIAFEVMGDVLGIREPLASFDDLDRFAKGIPEERMIQICRTEPLFRRVKGGELGVLYAWGRRMRTVFDPLWDFPPGMHPSALLAFAMYDVTFGMVYDLSYSEFESQRLPLCPYIADSDSWGVFARMLQISERESLLHLQVSQEQAALSSFSNQDLSWLSNVTIEELARLREVGFMEEMRQLFRVNAAKLQRASVEDFRSVWAEVSTTINERLAAHSEEIRRKEAEYKRSLKLSSASLLLNGGIGLASVALPPLLPVAIASAAFSLIVGGKSVRDLVHDHKERTHTTADLANRPVAFLFSLRERGKTLKAR